MSARKQENFYRRDPMKALHGMVGLSMDEKATYNTMLDLLYASWKPLRDDDKADRLFIANWVGCAPQKLNPIISRLIERGRIIRIEIDGKSYLSDEAFEAERAKVKGFKVSEKSGEVGTNSGEVDENSEEVETNLPLLDDEIEQNQSDKALEKRREEEKREDKNGGDDSAHVADALGWPLEKRDWISSLCRETSCADLERSAKDAWPVNLPSRDAILSWRRAEVPWDIIVEVVTELTANKRDGPPNSLGYYTRTVLQTHANRKADPIIPEAKSNERRNPNYKTAAERGQDSTISAFGRVFADLATGETDAGRTVEPAEPLRIAGAG